jgi:hypothetical protein
MSLNLEEKTQNNHQPVGANIPKQIIPQQNLIENKDTYNQTEPSIKQIESKDSLNIKNLNSTINQENISNKNQDMPQKNPNLYNTINGFNPMNHVPPKYDIYGYLKPIEKRKEDMTILLNKDKIKIPWCDKNSNISGAMTQTELIAKRKKEKIPDISYDLDKDGYVGGRDYVIAKRYDIDNDGKLNEQEKKAAYEGIKNKIEENYVWNIDKLGGVRPLRLLQKRGKFIDAEDFLPIRDTYPKHPITEVIPHCATYTELKHLRKQENIKNINDKMVEWEKTHPTRFYSGQIIGDSNKPKKPPKFTSVSQIKAEKDRNNRIKCGLNPETTDNRNNTIKPPSLEYIYNPKHKTKGEIEEDFHKENFLQSKKLSLIKHKSDVERLNEREDEIFANLYSTEERKTYTKIKEKNKKEANEYNIKTFSKQTLGVHGHDLPKFSENEQLKYFWKNKDGYCENPKFTSQREYLESIKYFKPPGEDLYLNEHRDEEPKWIDPFKKEHYPLEKKRNEKDIITDLNRINIFEGFDPSVVKKFEYDPRHKHVYRWTSLVNQFAPNKFKKGRFFDSLPEDKGNKSDDKEIFTNYKGFMSNYMKNMANKENNKINKNKENNALQNENVRPMKDLLFQKFSANIKEQNKSNSVNKNISVRTKGF